MTRATRVTIAAAALLCLVATPARAADREWRRYRWICEKLHLDGFHRTPPAERDRLAVLVKLGPADDAPPGTPLPVITIAARAGPIRLVPAADGTIDIPVSEALLAEDPPVLTSAPEGQKSRVQLDLRPVLPSGATLPLSEVGIAVAQANKVIKAQAGFFSFAIPTLRAVVAVYPPGQPQAATLTAPGVERTLTTDAKGRLRIPSDAALEAAGARVALAAPPLRFELDE